MTEEVVELPRPQIETAPKPVSVTEGEVIKLEIKYSGPEPKVTWGKDGKKYTPRKIMDQDKRFKIDWDMDSDVYFLNIADATPKDTGKMHYLLSNI